MRTPPISTLLKAAFFSIALSIPCHAADSFKNICGSVDVATTENTQLENLIFTLDLAKGPAKNYVQCGLPGEKLAICSACETKPSKEIMDFIRPFLAEKNHTEWHERWHTSRATAGEISSQAFEHRKKEGWFPQNETLEDFKKIHTAKNGTGAGEDFFFMHRLMLKMVQLESAAAGLPCIAPWKDVPDLDDKEWPLPRPLADQDDHEQAENTLEGFRSALAKYRDPAKLKTLSLNKLGAIVEPAFHQTMHNFYRSSPPCSEEAKNKGYCDDLVPIDTSPLNKYFWKIHGMLDLLVGDWLKANGYSEIAADCSGKKKCYQWQSSWVGKRPTE